MRRQKWDVPADHEAALAAAQAAAVAALASVQPMPASAFKPGRVVNRAGIGSAGVTGINHVVYGGTGAAPGALQGSAAAAAQPPPPRVEMPAGYAPGQPLDEEMKRRIQASAAAVVERMNQVGAAAEWAPEGGL